ncbi:MAG: glycosyltransferase [Chitinivibrionales bacterium]|nr:glycosyltransferase [Chitinivibrionales bacterium]
MGFTCCMALFFALVCGSTFLAVVYAYAGFPVLLKVISPSKSRAPQRNHAYKPPISILIPAYNEEKVIARKIDNCLALEYPRELLEIMVCSDCSDDRTVEIVQNNYGDGVSLFDYRERSGKTGVVNKSLPRAQGEIVVLTDANTMFEPDAVAKMISLYSSGNVGAVLGQVRLFTPGDSVGVDKEVAYRDFEADLKFREGLFGAAVGAFGGFYSIRKKLFTPLPPNAYSNDDLLIPARILSQGYRVVFDRAAISREETGKSVSEEFGRRVRIGAGNFQSFFLLLHLLNPLKGGAWFFYVSHKVLRWYSPFLLLLMLISTVAALSIPWFVYVLIAQGAFYAGALAGYGASRMGKSVPVIGSIYHFVSMNIAILFGFFRYLRGIKSAVWQSTQRAVV